MNDYFPRLNVPGTIHQMSHAYQLLYGEIWLADGPNGKPVIQIPPTSLTSLTLGTQLELEVTNLFYSLSDIE